jgi:hypothetical protein
MSREAGRRSGRQRVSIEAKLAFLRSGASYSPPTRHVTVVETHYAWVFLVDRRAYKLKKPLRHGRIDYRSLANRRRGCAAELLLNRRLAPAVYQALVPLSLNPSGRLVLGPGMRVVDWLVRMRRLPAARCSTPSCDSASCGRASCGDWSIACAFLHVSGQALSAVATRLRGPIRNEIVANRRAVRADDALRCLRDICAASNGCS